jgi:hypothetical protein
MWIPCFKLTDPNKIKENIISSGKSMKILKSEKIWISEEVKDYLKTLRKNHKKSKFF